MSAPSKPFVERTITIDGREVGCRFFQPIQDGTSYRCQYEIDWPSGVRSKSAMGADGVQALLQAFQRAHTELLAERENDGSVVLWFGQSSLGLPIPDVIRDWDPENKL